MQISLKKDNPEKAYIKVMEEIRQLIMEGGLTPGDRLLSERALSAKLNVSRTVIREALKSLEMLGVVEVKAGGTFIKEPELSGVYHALSYSMALNDVTIFDLLETRKIIEVQAIKLAANRRTDRDLAILSKLLLEMKIAMETDNLEMGIETDYKFHSYLVKATQNKALSIMLEATSDLFKEALSVIRGNLTKFRGMDKAIYAQHYLMLKAIKEQDVVNAEKIMTEHLNSLESELRMIIKGIDPEPPNITDYRE